MQDNGSFARIWYADILQLIWLIIDTDYDIYIGFTFSPHQITQITKSRL